MPIKISSKKKRNYFTTIKKYRSGNKKTKKMLFKGGTIIKKEFEDGKYEGQFEDEKRHGIGIMVYNDGSKYKGYWENDKKHGEGAILFPNGDVYRGYWEDGKKNGKGAIKYHNNDEGYLYFSGNWKDDMKNGEGIFVDKYNKEYKVNYENDKQIGEKIYKNYIPEISNKPLTIKSAPLSIQLDGNCFAHAIARNITRLFLVLTLIDGEKSEEMFIAIFCFLVLQNGKNYDTTNKKSYCKANYPAFEYQKQFYNPLLTEIDSIFTYKYKDIPCDIIVGGCRIDIKKDTPILTFTEEEKNTFISGLNKITPYLTYEFIEYKYDIVKKNYPPKKIADLLKKKLQPCIIINGCKYDPNSGDIIVELNPGDPIYYYDNDNNKKEGIVVKANKNEKKEIISYDINPRSYFRFILSSTTITINNSNISTKMDHAFILRSWRKTRNDSEFCYKNSWFDSSNVCIDDVRNLCKSIVPKTHKSIDENVNITFICPNFDLDRIKANDIELYNKIKTRIDMIHDTTYNLENKKRKKIDGDSGEDKEDVEENENKSISKKVTSKKPNKKLEV